jgi:transposase
MMGHRQVPQEQLFYEFSLEAMVPPDHLLRAMDRFVDLSGVRPLLASTYSSIGRPSVDPELMIRMLLVGYCYGIRSERRLCEELGLNLAYRWFCRLDLTDLVPVHSTFSKNRHGRFRDCDLLRQVFEAVLARCIAEGLVGGRQFGAVASLIKADASRYSKIRAEDWSPAKMPPAPHRNIWKVSMTRLLARQPRCSQRHSHPRIPPPASPERMVTGPSSPTAPTIWSTGSRDHFGR